MLKLLNLSAVEAELANLKRAEGLHECARRLSNVPCLEKSEDPQRLILFAHLKQRYLYLGVDQARLASFT